MNETINSMLTRRSIRSYKPTQIAERDLNWILEAAIYAATSRNLQSWDFTVIQNKDMLKKLSKAAADTLRKMGDARSLEKANDPDFSPFYHAPLPQTRWVLVPAIWAASRKRSTILLLPRHL